MARRALIIEPNGDRFEELTALLQGLAFTWEHLASGEAGLERLRRDPLPDVVFVALLMPGFDGVEFRKEQLADPLLSKVPTIFLTAFAPSQHVTVGIPVLTPPFKLPQLQVALDEVGLGHLQP